MPLLATDRPGAQYATDRYGLLFVLLAAVFTFAALDDASRVVRIGQGVTVIAIVVMTLQITGVPPRRMRPISIAGLGLGIAVVVVGASGGPAVRGVLAIASGLVLMVSVGALVRRIFESERISLREIGGSIAAYIEVALAFALVYGGVAQLTSEPFFVQGDQTGLPFLYFSVVTMTTLGYGDLSPATDLGRSLVMVQTLFGQVFLVVLVAYLVGSLGSSPVGHRAAEGPRAGDASGPVDHPR